MSFDPGNRPFFGRRNELAEIAAAIRDAAAGRGRVIQITGEAGIGKTRLVEEVEPVAAAEGLRVLWTRGWDGGNAPPYWPWVEILRAVVRMLGAPRARDRLGDSLATLLRFLPDLRHDLGPVPRARSGSRSFGKRERFRFFDTIGRLLRDLAREEPLMLVLDDLHTADEDSLESLCFVARGIRHDRLLVIVTLRDESVPRDDRLRSLLTGIGREGFTLPLRGLRPDEVMEALTAGLGRKIAGSVLTGILETTGGTPLFVEELVRELRSTGARPDVAGRISPPDRIRESARRRLRDLAAAQRPILETASVVGLVFDVETVAGVNGVDTAVVRKTLDDLRDRGLVREVSAPLGRYVFAHPMLRDTLRNDLGLEDRAALHGRIGEVLEGRDSRHGGLSRSVIAEHYFEAIPAGYRRHAVRAAGHAAQDAVRRLAWSEATDQLRRALEAIGESGDSALQRKRKRLEKELRAAERELRKAGSSITSPAPILVTSELPSFGPPKEPPPFCRREGHYWAFEYRGRSSRFRATRGFEYIVDLLRSPHVAIPAIDLVRRHARPRDGDPPPEGARAGDAGEILDERAREQYRGRIAALSAELVEAESNGDLGRTARTREEIEILTGQLRSAFGLGGRSRKAASDLERARVALTKPLRRALRKILEVDEPLGRHLQASVRTGHFCVYAPGSPPSGGPVR